MGIRRGSCDRPVNCKSLRVDGDDGTSLIEVMVIGVGILLPLILSIAAMGAVQRAALGVSAATRDAARSASVASSRSQAADAALRTAAATLAAYGLDAGSASVRIEGEFERGKQIGVSVGYPVVVSLAGVFEFSLPLRITSTSRFSIGLHYPMRR